MKLAIYSYKDHVDMVKQHKKKLEAYSLISNKL
ncbi:YfmQ family protein [Priestia aryabhattai]